MFPNLLGSFPRCCCGLPTVGFFAALVPMAAAKVEVSIALMACEIAVVAAEDAGTRWS